MPSLADPVGCPGQDKVVALDVEPYLLGQDTCWRDGASSGGGELWKLKLNIYFFFIFFYKYIAKTGSLIQDFFVISTLKLHIEMLLLF